MVKHNPPEYKKSAFDCPDCGAYAAQEWIDFYSNPQGSVGFLKFEDCEASKCLHCMEYEIWFRKEMIYPAASTAPQPNPDMPEDVSEDFNEARAVLAYSPRSSAALLRLALEKLCIHLGLPGQNLNENIGALVKQGLSPKIQKMLDIVRVVGNNAVHPGELDLKDDQQTALILFDLINLIVEQMITVPQMVDTTYEKLPEGAREQIEKRDRAKTNQESATP